LELPPTPSERGRTFYLFLGIQRKERINLPLSEGVGGSFSAGGRFQKPY